MKKKTIDTLDALDRIIAADAQHLQPRQPDEFTVADYLRKLREKGIGISSDSVHRRLGKLVDEGKLTYRLGPQNNGGNCKYYKPTN